MHDFPLFLAGGEERSVESLDQQMLVLRGGPRQNLEVGEDGVQLRGRKLTEIAADHGSAGSSENPRFTCNGTGGDEIVPGHHADGDPGGLAGRNGIFHVSAERVGDTNDSKEGEAGLLEV